MDWHKEQAMNRLVAALMEPVPAPISARNLRAQVRMKEWYSCNPTPSPDGWWIGEIGTDHGPPEDDDKPVRWRPARDAVTEIADAMLAVEKLHKNGYRVNLQYLHDGYVVDVTPFEEIAPIAQVGVDLSEGMPVAICLAVIEAMSSPRYSSPPVHETEPTNGTD